MSLVLFEEEVYKRAELAGRIELLLGPAQVADLRAAVEELLDFEVSRAEGSALVSGRDAGLGDDPEDDLDADSDDVIRLFTSRGLDHWKVGGLVGSGRLPKSGLVFEVLPKVTAGSSDDDLQAARLSLRRMWSFAADLPLNRDENRAEVAAEHMPLHEWLAQRFLGEVEALLRRGIRLQYVEHEDNLSTLRGRLLPLQNIRHNAFAPHRFYCRFEVLSPDRPENRLIRSALAVLVRHSCERNRRRAADLSERMHEVPFSRNVANDFAAWRDDRLMAHYREIRDTCGWILNRRGTAPVRAEQSMRGCFARIQPRGKGSFEHLAREQQVQRSFFGHEPPRDLRQAKVVFALPVVIQDIHQGWTVRAVCGQLAQIALNVADVDRGASLLKPFQRDLVGRQGALRL